MTTNDPGSSGAVSRASGGKASRGCLGVFFGVFLVVGTLFFYWFTLEPIGQALAARKWQPTPCTITSSRVESHSSDDGTTYSIEIEFDYEVDGKRYHSDRYSFVSFSSSGRKGKKKVVAAHPVGSEQTCYVNPSDPSEAVINPRISGSMFIGCFTLIFVIIGMAGLAYTFGILRWKPRAAKPVAWKPTTKHAASEEEYGNFDRGTVTLRPQSTPWGRVFGLLLVALFWNGIVSLFLWQVVQGFLGGNPSWFLTLFMIPFVLVGLGLILLWVHSLLSLWNPRAELTLSSASFELGESIEVSWKMIGNANAIRRLSITVEGVESARYRRGTNTYTDKDTFAKIVVVETENFLDVGEGKAQFTIPAGQMHSFEGSHNKVLWMLKLQGEIAWWPDVAEEYKLAVMPHQVSNTRAKTWEMPVS